MPYFFKFSFILFLFLYSIATFSQSDASISNDLKRSDIGIEIQVYPTGIIPCLRFEHLINSKTSINLRFGYQIINHRDLGVHDDESGSGYGFSLGIRKFLNSSQQGLSLGLRSDIWFNKVKWSDETPTPISGVTNITVIQPTLVGEYSIPLNTSTSVVPSFSFGWEWNIKTNGAPTGEGAIILLGCTIAWKI